jgi:hypothetical protein
MSAVIVELISTSVTFRKGTAEKLCFVLLNVLDLALTLLAVSQGARELNPFMQSMLGAPYRLFLIKLAIPVLLAWIVPAKLLIPAIIFLAFILGWDIKELLLLKF